MAPVQVNSYVTPVVGPAPAFTTPTVSVANSVGMQVPPMVQESVSGVMVTPLPPTYGSYLVQKPAKPPAGTVVVTTDIDRLGRAVVNVAEGYDGVIAVNQENTQVLKSYTVQIPQPPKAVTVVTPPPPPPVVVAPPPPPPVVVAPPPPPPPPVVVTPPPPPPPKVVYVPPPPPPPPVVIKQELFEYRPLPPPPPQVDIVTTYKSLFDDRAQVFAPPPPDYVLAEPLPKVVKQIPIVTPYPVLPQKTSCWSLRNLCLLLGLLALLGLLGWLLLSLLKKRPAAIAGTFIPAVIPSPSIVINTTTRAADSALSGIRIVPYNSTIVHTGKAVRTVIPAISVFPSNISTTYHVVSNTTTPARAHAVIQRTTTTKTLTPFTPVAAYWYANGGHAGGNVTTTAITYFDGPLPAFYTNGSLVNGTFHAPVTVSTSKTRTAPKVAILNPPVLSFTSAQTVPLVPAVRTVHDNTSAFKDTLVSDVGVEPLVRGLGDISASELFAVAQEAN